MASITDKHYLDINAWVSESQLDAAKQSGRTCCPTCRPYGAPGFIVNAHQWVNCPQCKEASREQVS